MKSVDKIPCVVKVVVCKAILHVPLSCMTKPHHTIPGQTRQIRSNNSGYVWLASLTFHLSLPRLVSTDFGLTIMHELQNGHNCSQI